MDRRNEEKKKTKKDASTSSTRASGVSPDSFSSLSEISEESRLYKTGRGKIEEICIALRKETLEPALAKAAEIEAEATRKAACIIEEATKKATDIVEKAEKQALIRKEIFDASLNHAAKQVLEWLKQEIEQKCLNKNLKSSIDSSLASPEVLTTMILGIIEGIRKNGIDADLTVLVPETIDVDQINQLLGKELLKKLREKSVVLGSMKGGVEIKLHDHHMTLDVTSEALLELLLRYTRKDFHRFFFNTPLNT